MVRETNGKEENVRIVDRERHNYHRDSNLSVM